MRLTMIGFWTKLRRKSASAVTCGDMLARMFVGYLPNRPLHPGNAAALTEAERDANLEHFVPERETRLEIIHALVRDHWPDPAPMLNPDADGLAAKRAVDGWLNATLPRRPMSPIVGDETPNPPVHAFRASDRTGADIYYSFVVDLARLAGEAIRLRNGRFAWRVNRLADWSDMESYLRIYLIKPGHEGWAATMLHVNEHLIGICYSKMSFRGDVPGRSFGELLKGAVERGYDPR